MKTLLRSFVFSSLSLAMLGVLPSACTINAADDSSNDDAGPTTLPDGALVQPTFPFVPSNVSALGTHDLSQIQDEVISQDCSVDTDSADFCSAYDLPGWIDTQPDGTQIRVYAFKSFTLAQTAHLTVTGSMPVVILAFGDMTINGQVLANAKGAAAGPGGFKSSAEFTKGGGPGGGTAGVIGEYNPGGSNVGGISGGGGSFCGVGGQGTKEADASGTTPAPLASPAAYGTPSLVPLVAGSSGGEGGLSEAGGGGGAIQLVAGGAFKVSSFAFVNAGGGAGGDPGETLAQQGSGAGSGGAILVEAMMAEIDGALAANGGSGSGYSGVGQDGSPDANPAVGGKDNGAPQGGNGSAAATIDGAAGTTAADGSAGSGGGGAGRIRINTKSGTATVSGTISPAMTSACGTQGMIVLANNADAGK
ncbi:MAG TPA: hypothetical protein VF407_19610 [Polyangiaceae bacterium]